MANDISLVVLGVVLGSIAGLACDPIRAWLMRVTVGPALAVTYDDSVIRATANGIQTDYFRLCVKNRGKTLARGCRAYLVGVHALVEGQPHKRPFDDSLPLYWSFTSGIELDLAPGISQHLDILMLTYKTAPPYHDIVFRSPVQPTNYEGIVSMGEKYILTVVVVGENIRRPRAINVTLVTNPTNGKFMHDATYAELLPFK